MWHWYRTPCWEERVDWGRKSLKTMKVKQESMLWTYKNHDIRIQIVGHNTCQHDEAHNMRRSVGGLEAMWSQGEGNHAWCRLTTKIQEGTSASSLSQNGNSIWTQIDQEDQGRSQLQRNSRSVSTKLDTKQGWRRLRKRQDWKTAQANTAI